MMYFQDLIMSLQRYWADQGCAILQPCDTEVGAGTSHIATALRSLEFNPWNVVYVQPSRRPQDGRYGQNPNRTQHYYQLQVLMKPSPDNLKELCLKSMEVIGIDSSIHDIRFIEDNWANPTLGACGLGWEIWCDGMEFIQYTYMQQIGGIELKPVVGEITYGLERMAMYVQNVDNFWDIKWNKQGLKYSDVFNISEKEECEFNFKYHNNDMLMMHFKDYIREVPQMLKENLVVPAYQYCLKAAHIFNILEARGIMSVTERTAYISEIRSATLNCCSTWIKKMKNI